MIELMRLTRPVRLREAVDAMDFLTGIQRLASRIATPVVHYLRNLAAIARALNHVTVEVGEDGAVTLTHTTGSSTRFRADGNVDVCAARNHWIRTDGYLLLNSSETTDRKLDANA